MFPGVQPRICHRFRDISSQNFDFSSFDLDRANPSAQNHQNGRRRTIHLGLPYPKNFSPIAPTMYEICVTKVFHFLALGGQPLGQSSPKGEKAWRTPRSTSLQNYIALRQPTPEISVTKIPADKQTEKNKYASCPDWRISPHADRRSPITAKHKFQNSMRRNVFHSTHGPRRSGKFVAPR